jgi:hypothetical protein
MANISRFDTAWLVSDGSNGRDSSERREKPLVRENTYQVS